MNSHNIKELFQRTELVLVRPDAMRKDIQSLCLRALEKNFRGICVNSSRVAEAVSQLEDSEVKIISTIGFPSGVADSDVKRYEVEVAIDHGAQEFEFIPNLGQIKDGDEAKLLRELRDIVDAAEERPVSVLLGTKLLSRDEQILVCNLAVEAGAKFLNAASADLDSIKFLRESLGQKFGLKVSGEIADAPTARELLGLGATNLAATNVPQF